MPTAVHGPPLTHETALSWLAGSPGWFGLGWIVQVTPGRAGAAAAPAGTDSGRSINPSAAAPAMAMAAWRADTDRRIVLSFFEAVSPVQVMTPAVVATLREYRHTGN